MKIEVNGNVHTKWFRLMEGLKTLVQEKPIIGFLAIGFLIGLVWILFGGGGFRMKRLWEKYKTLPEIWKYIIGFAGCVAVLLIAMLAAAIWGATLGLKVTW